jgi:SH3-like domain-containing protein
MSRLLLSLWILGAVLISANTLIILGWPTSKPKIDSGVADRQAVKPTETLTARNQPGTGGNEEASATNDAPAVRLESDVVGSQSSSPQTDSGQAAPNSGPIGPNPATRGNASAPMPASPYAVSPYGPSAQQQQAQVAPAVPPAPGQQQPQAQTIPPNQPAQEQAQNDPASPPQNPDQGEWAKVSATGANVRSGPSSSASRLATLSPGQALRVVSRKDGWVEVASPNGSETGWIYERLLERTSVPDRQGPAAQGSALQPSGAAQELQQDELVKVVRPGAKVLAGASEKAAMLFGFPEGRELRVLSRQPGWVQIMDPSSKQVGWIAESSLAPADAAQQQAAAPQRPNRATPYDAAKTAEMNDAWLLGEEGIAPPDDMVEPPARPRKWGRRGGRFAGALRRAFGGF